MNPRSFALAALLASFLALTGYVLVSYGPIGWVGPMVENWATRLAVVDLLLCLAIACGFIVRDARQQGISPAPYLILALLTGAAGPLAYLLRRSLSQDPRGSAASRERAPEPAARGVSARL